ncbi:MAG: T9SS type A sorting domain-containing protein [Melioribacteraceae bacterium]|nr:T9SS type A sorting domain-containing protein [Melioribacteraceae bacterium]
MKTLFYLLVVFFLFLKINYSQVYSTFDIDGKSACTFDIDYGTNVYYYKTENYFLHDTDSSGLVITKTDFNGKQIKTIPVNNNIFCQSPVIKISNNRAFIVWRDAGSLTFNSHIMGSVLDLTVDTLLIKDVKLNSNFGDSERFAPEIEIINDTTVFYYWTGNEGLSGHASESIYGRFFNYILEPLGDAILLSDSSHNSIDVKFGMAKTIYDSSSEILNIFWIDDFEGSRKIFHRKYDLKSGEFNRGQIISLNSVNDLYSFDVKTPDETFMAVAWGGENGGKDILYLTTISHDVYRTTLISDDVAPNVFPKIEYDDSYDNILISYDKKKGNNYKIFGKVFNPRSKEVSTEVQISDDFNSNNSWPFLKFNTLTGEFICTWISSDDKIRGKIFNLENYFVGVDKTKNEIPFDFELHQNYPNPFNPTTTIEFEVSNSGYFELKVFNILGKEIKTLYKGNAEVGNHKIVFNGENLASGTYFFRLKSKDLEKTIKTLLVK